MAIKVLLPGGGAHGYEPQRFLREIRIAAQLSHPQILPVHDSGEFDGMLYFVMPYAGCETLRDRLRQEGALPVEAAIRITRAVATALGYAHRHNVIHRDIKPENILLQEGEPVVADFGVATAISAAGGDSIFITDRGFAVGTPAYMSPEQASAERDLDGRSDHLQPRLRAVRDACWETTFYRLERAGHHGPARHRGAAADPVPAPHRHSGGWSRLSSEPWPRPRPTASRPWPNSATRCWRRRIPGAAPGSGEPGHRRAAVRQLQRRPRERVLQRRDNG